MLLCFFFSSRRRHTRWTGDWSSDVCSSDLPGRYGLAGLVELACIFPGHLEGVGIEQGAGGDPRYWLSGHGEPAPKPWRLSCLTAAAYGAGATVARMVVCSWRSTCGLREPPPGSPQTMMTSVPGCAAAASSIASESISPSLLL